MKMVFFALPLSNVSIVDRPVVFVIAPPDDLSFVDFRHPGKKGK